MKKEENFSSLIDNLDIKTHPKFLQVKETFEKLFRNKGFFPDKRFDKEIWFLQNDIQFQNLIRPSQNSTPMGESSSNKMLGLLRELSDNDDLKKMSIETGKFIDKICTILIKSHQMVLRSRELIKEYNAHENVNILDLKYKMLNEKYREKIDSISKLNISILRIDLFPEGKFNFNFHFIEKNPNDCSMSESRNNKLKDNKILSIKQGGEILMLNNSEVENNFDTINFTALETNESKLSENFENSGTSLSTFNVQIYKNEELFAESQPEYFLDMSLLLIDKLRDIDKTSFTTNWKIKAMTNLKQSSINNLLTEYDVILEFKFDLDPITRACMINRILQILKDAIKTESQNEMNKNEILDVYFTSISEQVKFILNRKDDEKEDGNCNCQSGCLIY